MLLLGIETSNQSGSLALLQEGQLLSARELPAAGRRHARMLLPEIQDMLRQLSILPKQLECIAVSIGPGSFTGLRVGVVCGKTLAYAVQCPLVAVDTHLAIASRLPDEVQEASILDDALRGEIFVGEYRRSTNGWQRIGAPRLISAVTWVSEQTRGSICVGPGLKQHGELAAERLHLLGEEYWYPTAQAIAELGARQTADGVTADIWSLEPHYIRRSYAEEKAGATQG